MESAIGGSKVHIAKYSKPKSKAHGKSIQGSMLKPFLLPFFGPLGLLVTPCRAFSRFVPEIHEAVYSDTL